MNPANAVSMLKLRSLSAIFILLSLSSGCKNPLGGSNDSSKVESTYRPGMPSGTQEWDFSNPSDYIFDPDHISVGPQGAALRQVTTLHNSESEFEKGVQNGTTFSNGSLVLDSATSINTHLSRSWTPKFDDLAGYWKMDGNWNDSSGKENHGSAVGSVSALGPAKVGTNSGTFNGTVTISSSTTLHITDKVTIAAWIYKGGSFTGAPQIFKESTFGSNYSLFVESDSRGVSCDFYVNGTRRRVNSDYNINTRLRTWIHTTCTFDASTGQYAIYINGQVQKSGAFPTGTISTSSNGFVIGHQWGGNGRIDDLAVWNATLSSDEVALLYESQKLKYLGSYTSPVLDIGISAPWTGLTPRTTLPFHKELPGDANGDSVIDASDSEKIADYPSVIENLGHGLKAYWRFEGDFKDSSGNSADLTPTGGATFSSDSKLGARSALFDGADDVLNYDVADWSGDFTLSVWIKTNTVTTEYNAAFATDTATTPNSFQIDMGGPLAGCANEFRFQLFDDNSNRITACFGKSNADWNHLTAVFEGTNLRLYLNGKLNSSSTILSFNPKFSAYRVGNNRAGIKLWDGLVDDVAVWERPLSADEITQLYRRGANRLKYQVRSCTNSTCSGSSWVGSTGSTSSYFSERHNYSAIDGSGNGSGYVNTGPLNLSFSHFPVAARPANNRYFQYRVIMESDDENDLCSGAPCMPELKSIEVKPADRYFGGSPAIQTKAPISVTQLSRLNASALSSCVSFQLSTDEGATWKWWDSSANGGIGAWGVATSGVTQSNPLPDFTASRLGELAGGSFKVKSYLSTNVTGDLTSPCVIRSLELTYSP